MDKKFKMSQKSEYNARFSFEDPLSKLSLSRSSRYRIRKRKRCAEAIEAGEPCDPRSMSDAELDRSVYFTTMDSQDDDSSSTHEFEDQNKSTEKEAADRVTMDWSEFSEADELDSDVSQEAPANESEQTALIQVTSDLEQQLYEGSELTVSSSCLLLKKFRMQHRLTETAFADLLRLISLHCPRPNKCLTSPYLFNKQFGEHKLPMEFHNFCSNCLCRVEGDKKCPNPSCEVDLSKFGAKSQFIEVPVEPQLAAILQRKYSNMEPHIKLVLRARLLRGGRGSSEHAIH